jgi:hypothetical protein
MPATDPVLPVRLKRMPGVVACFDRVGVDHGDRLTDFVARLLDARSGDDDVIGTGGFLRGDRRRGDKREKRNARIFQHGRLPHAGNEGGACRNARAIDRCPCRKRRKACGPGTEAAPAAWSSLDGILRAMAFPWTQALSDPRRQVSWLAGQGSMHAFPGCPSGCPGPWPERYILLAAYSCRDSLGFGGSARTPLPRSHFKPFRAPARSCAGQALHAPPIAECGTGAMGIC